MRLVLTALIDFNKDRELTQKDDDVPLDPNGNSKVLIDSQSLVARLSNNSKNTEVNDDEYHKALMSATLTFKNLSFRHQYFNWIYASYSDSTTNRRRVQRNERMVLFDWAKRFNQRHDHLKILKVEPLVDNHQFTAMVSMIGFSQPFGQLSFDFRGALEAEYDQDYDQAFYHLEVDEGRRVARILETTFTQYIPDADFQFINQNPDYEDVVNLKPAKFDPEWINKQQQKSAETSQAKSNQLQKTCNSILSSANSQSAADSQTIDKLSEQLQSATSERTRLISEKSQAISTLKANASSSVVSSLSSASQSASKTRHSFNKALSSAHSDALHFASLAAKNASKFSSANQQAKALSSAKSVQSQLHSKNQHLVNRINSCQKNSVSVSQSFKAINQSLKASLSNVISLSNQNAATIKASAASVTSSASLELKSTKASLVAVKHARSKAESASQSVSNYNYASLKNRSLSTSKSLSFAQSATVKQDFQQVSAAKASSNSDLSNVKTNGAKSQKPKGHWGIAKRRSYIPMIIIISIIIIILLIFIFPLLRF